MTRFSFQCLSVAAFILLFALLDIFLRSQDVFRAALLIAVLVLITLAARRG